MSRKVSPFIAWPLIIVSLSGLFVTYKYKEEVKDWWFFRSYVPSQKIEKLTIESGMNENGSKLFYRANPELTDKETITDKCGSSHNLGCIVTGPKIYITDYDEYFSRYYFQSSVTAAHEMLHLAYSRLSEDEKNKVNNNIEEAIAFLRDRDVLDRINSYPEEERLDEAHSILPTEVKDLSTELELYYGLYFEDRSKSYNAFSNSRSLID